MEFILQIAKAVMDKAAMMFVASIILFGITGITGHPIFGMIGILCLLPFFICVLGALLWSLITFIRSCYKSD